MSSCLKLLYVMSSLHKWAGRLFQTCGPATAKLLSPNVFKCARGTAYDLSVEERSRRFTNYKSYSNVVACSFGFLSLKTSHSQLDQVVYWSCLYLWIQVFSDFMKQLLHVYWFYKVPENWVLSDIQKLQRVQNTAAQIVLQVPRQSPSQPLLEELHWLPVRQRIDYKLAILTYKIWNTSTTAYLSHHIRPRESTRHLRSSTTPLLHRPTTRTHFADRAFGCSAPAVWNSLNTDSLCCNSLALFKRSLKTFPFRQTFRPSSSRITRL